MKIVSRRDFYKLPEGILFCKGKQWIFDSPCIKGETIIDHDEIPYGFLYTDVCLIDSTSSNDYFRKLEDSLEKGTSYYINRDEESDVNYTPNEVYMIYEPRDLVFLREVINKCLDDCV
jgi:hypothetical protein